jgi:cytochrome c peroxidase
MPEAHRLLAAVLSALPLCAQGGLPPMPVPAGNPVTPEKAVLGKILFWEEQMSSNNRVACGTCHRPQFGGGDPRRLPHPGPDGVQPSPDDTFGSPGTVRSDAQNCYQPSALFNLREQVTSRASPSFVVAAWFPEMFWDGRARGPVIDPPGGAIVLPQDGALESQAAAPVLNGVEMAHDARLWSGVRSKLQGSRPMALATNLPPDVAAAIARSPA